MWLCTYYFPEGQRGRTSDWFSWRWEIVRFLGSKDSKKLGMRKIGTPRVPALAPLHPTGVRRLKFDEFERVRCTKSHQNRTWGEQERAAPAQWVTRRCAVGEQGGGSWLTRVGGPGHFRRPPYPNRSVQTTWSSLYNTSNSQNNFSFDCTCSLYSLPATERVLSDDRLTEVQHLDNVIGDGTHLRLYPQQHLHKYKIHTAARSRVHETSARVA